MRKIESNRLSRHLAIGLAVCGTAFAPSSNAASIGGMPQARPEAVGLSSERLKQLDRAMQRLVDEKQLAGVVTVAARHGKVFQSKTYGLRDLESAAPMQEDAIFRIYSMTKPITGVAMMILYEEGKWSPQDPVSKHIPEFANLKVYKGQDAAGKMQLEDPGHPPTMRELMTHTAGFSYGFGDEPVDKLYKDDKGRNTVFEASSPQEMINSLAKIPLLYQPGTRWVYSIAVDIQGYLVEKLSGKPLAVFMKERIFDPLGMVDTAFYVPKEKWGRFATLYQREDKNGIVVVNPQATLAMPFSEEPALPSGGGGLVSTASDYLKFAQMLLNGGEHKGVRILGPETVKLMAANHMPDALMTGDPSNGHIRPGLGFGYDFAVFTDPALADNPTGKGTYYWGGAAGTWFWIDPAHDIVFVGMVQNFMTNPNTWDLRELTQQTLYSALLEPRK